MCASSRGQLEVAGGQRPRDRNALIAYYCYSQQWRSSVNNGAIPKAPATRSRAPKAAHGALDRGFAMSLKTCVDAPTEGGAALRVKRWVERHWKARRSLRPVLVPHLRTRSTDSLRLG